MPRTAATYTTIFQSTMTHTTMSSGKGERATPTDRARGPADQTLPVRLEATTTNIETTRRERILGQTRSMTARQAHARTPVKHSTALAVATIALAWAITTSATTSRPGQPRLTRW